MEVLGNHWSSHRPKLSSPVGRGFICSPPRVHTSPSPLTGLHHAIPFSRGPARSSSLQYTPLTFHRRCADKARTLGHRYRSRQMLHTRNCLSIGWTSGQGCLPFRHGAPGWLLPLTPACTQRSGQHTREASTPFLQVIPTIHTVPEKHWPLTGMEQGEVGGLGAL